MPVSAQDAAWSELQQSRAKLADFLYNIENTLARHIDEPEPATGAVAPPPASPRPAMLRSAVAVDGSLSGSIDSLEGSDDGGRGVHHGDLRQRSERRVRFNFGDDAADLFDDDDNDSLGGSQGERPAESRHDDWGEPEVGMADQRSASDYWSNSGAWRAAAAEDTGGMDYFPEPVDGDDSIGGGRNPPPLMVVEARDPRSQDSTAGHAGRRRRRRSSGRTGGGRRMPVDRRSPPQAGSGAAGRREARMEMREPPSAGGGNDDGDDDSPRIFSPTPTPQRRHRAFPTTEPTYVARGVRRDDPMPSARGARPAGRNQRSASSTGGPRRQSPGVASPRMVAYIDLDQGRRVATVQRPPEAVLAYGIGAETSVVGVSWRRFRGGEDVFDICCLPTTPPTHTHPHPHNPSGRPMCRGVCRCNQATWRLRAMAAIASRGLAENHRLRRHRCGKQGGPRQALPI